MINTKRKGTKHEKEARGVFVAGGYRVWKPGRAAISIGPNRYRYYDQDIMGIFDFVAWTKKHILYIQVKSTPQGTSAAKSAINSADLPNIKDLVYVVMERVPQQPKTFVWWYLDYQTSVWMKQKPEGLM